MELRGAGIPWGPVRHPDRSELSDLSELSGKLDVDEVEGLSGFNGS